MTPSRVYPLAIRYGYNVAFAAEIIAYICEKQANDKISHQMAMFGLVRVLATMIPTFGFGPAEMPAKRRRIDGQSTWTIPIKERIVGV